MNYAEVEYEAERFLRIENVNQMAQYLETPLYALRFIQNNRAYKEFFVRKSSGGKRRIEDPETVLKTIQQKLNDALQAVYYLHRSASAYGFQISVAHEKHPRNIKSNAECHINKPWMLNADFKDFFHQIDIAKLKSLFLNAPFKFDDELIDLVIDLCTHKDRLPMGAPTSPVLSNFASLTLDTHYEAFAKDNQLVYTRFVDDLTFSSQNEITEEQVQAIFQIAKISGLDFNPSKIKVYMPAHVKIVTGLVVADTITLPTEYIVELENEIEKFAHTWEVNTRAGQRNNAYLKKFRQQIEGRLQFAGFVLGHEHSKLRNLEGKYLQASQIDYFDAVSWTDFGYQYLTDSFRYKKTTK